MVKNILVITGIFLWVSLFSFSFAEEKLTITTYYPSPYGTYRELRAQRIVIGDDYTSGSEYCWEGTCTNTIDADADLVVQGNVGIGTITPSEKLEVSGNIKLSGATSTYKITNVATPTASSDVATKEYVDANPIANQVNPAWNQESRWFDIGDTRILTGRQAIYTWLRGTTKTINFAGVSGVPNPAFASAPIVTWNYGCDSYSFKRIVVGTSSGNHATPTGFTLYMYDWDYGGADDGVTIFYTAIGKKP